MPRNPRAISSTGIYHVTIRGINRQQIFETNKDYRMFLRSLQDTLKEHPMRVHAYCLMGNHVHLLVETEDDSLSETMKALEDSFVYRYNHEHDRTGVLFQGRFHSVPIETRRQFLCVLRYIHQNPMRAGLEECPGTYPWTSYFGYFHPWANDFLCRERVLEYFPEERMLQEFLKTRAKASEVYFSRGHKRIDPDLLIALMCEYAGVENMTALQSLPVSERDRVILILCEKGIPRRDISRVLGISVTQITRILENNKKGQVQISR